ncbi:hypothetical protein OG381_36800 [Streptomyces sp. NBC_00490]|uniref:hypothetical protein n=1 Tax=Streptomyces sp. NBC_00490 TaxID=2903657 RepID=UPI002E170CFB
MAEIAFLAAIPDERIAHALEDELRGYSASDVTVVGPKNMDPSLIPTIVTATLAGVGGIASLWAWLRRQLACLMIVNVQEGRIEVTYDCRERRGRTIVVCGDGTQVQVTDPGHLVDLSAVIEVASGGTATEIVSIVNQVGATAEVVRGRMIP